MKGSSTFNVLVDPLPVPPSPSTSGQVSMLYVFLGGSIENLDILDIFKKQSLTVLVKNTVLKSNFVMKHSSQNEKM